MKQQERGAFVSNITETLKLEQKFPKRGFNDDPSDTGSILEPSAEKRYESITETTNQLT